MTAVPTSAAETLLLAAKNARQLRGQTIVVKLGGSAMEDPDTTRGTLECVAALQTIGVQLVLVHGGGKPIDRAMADAGLKPRKVAGRRYTDDATLEIVVDVLKETIAPNLSAQLQKLGGNSFPQVHALDGERITLNGEDLGHVGKVTRVRLDDLRDMFEDKQIPIIPSLARDKDGNWLNVNADTAAAAVAGALQSEAVLFLTDTPGVLLKYPDPDSLAPFLIQIECQDLIRQGVIDGGMIPKVEACFEALESGARRAVILDGRHPHALLRDFLGDTRAGTTIVR